MAKFLNKTTFEIKEKEYNEGITDSNLIPYIYKVIKLNNDNEKYSEIVTSFELPNCDKKYWKIENNIPVEMSSDEKTVVDNNITLNTFNNRSSDQIEADIFDSCTTQEEIDALFDAFNNNPIFHLAIQRRNWTQARYIISKALSKGNVNQALSEKLLSQIPT